MTTTEEILLIRCQQLETTNTIFLQAFEFQLKRVGNQALMEHAYLWYFVMQFVDPSREEVSSRVSEDSDGEPFSVPL